jgi:hypothetical protein
MDLRAEQFEQLGRQAVLLKRDRAQLLPLHPRRTVG